MVKYDITSINSKGVNKIVKGSNKMDLSQELDKIIANVSEEELRHYRKNLKHL